MIHLSFCFLCTFLSLSPHITVPDVLLMPRRRHAALRAASELPNPQQPLVKGSRLIEHLVEGSVMHARTCQSGIRKSPGERRRKYIAAHGSISAGGTREVGAGFERQGWGPFDCKPWNANIGRMEGVKAIQTSCKLKSQSEYLRCVSGSETERDTSTVFSAAALFPTKDSS
jgi:hypothetical protein